MSNLRSSISLILLLSFSGVFAQSSQFRGENRDGIYNETGLLKTWPEGGPECILTVEGLGKGFSSAVLSDSIIFVTGMKEATDYLSAISLNGQIKWQVPYGNSWTKSFPDTRCTPTVDSSRVYVISGTGQMACFNVLDGKEIWSANVDSVFESKWHDWGVAESLLLVDNLVICTPAGKKAAVVAYDKFTGKLMWQSKSFEGQRCYASPVLFQYNGNRYLLASTTKETVALVPETGEVVWSFVHWQADRDPNEDGGQIYTNNPVVSGNQIFLTRGYNYPAMMLTIAEDGQSAAEKWIDNTLDNHHHGVILDNGFLFGSNWLSNGKGNWVCLEWNTGAVQWEETWFNKGPVIQADGMLYIMDEKGGNVGLVNPNPAKFDLVSTFKIDKGSGPYWSHPTIYNGKLFIRHGDVLLIFNVKT